MIIPIALVIAELEVGGTQRQILELAKGFDRTIFEPYVCCLSRSLAFANAFEQTDIPLHVIPKGSRYDISILPRLASFFRKKHIKAVVTYGFTADSWARVAARMAGVTLIVSSVRTSDEDIAMIHRVNRVLAGLTHHFIANSNAVANYLANSIGVEQARISVVPNGIDTARFAPTLADRAEIRRSIGVAESCLLIGAVNRLSPEKNVDAFVRIASLFLQQSRAEFVVIGDGPELSRLRLISKQLGLSGKLHWLGERNDVPRLLSCFDLAMLTSFREGLSNSILEYMAAGLPVVASEVGGNADLVIPGENGYLFPLSSLNVAVNQLLELAASSEIRFRMGQNGRQRAHASFSMKAMVTSTESLLLKLLHERDVVTGQAPVPVAQIHHDDSANPACGSKH